MDTRKRDLYAPLRKPQDFELTWPLLPGETPPSRKTLPACSGACEQGKRLCVTPAACRLPDGEHAEMEGAGAVVVPAVIAAALAVAAFVVLIAGWIS